MPAQGSGGQVTAARASSATLSGWHWGSGHEGDPPHPQIVCLIRKGVFGMGLFYVYLYSFLAVLGLRCCAGFSLVVARGGYSVVVAHDLLMTVASRHEHGL